MKVEVSKIKRPGIKVSVTLARAKRGGSRINIPVRTAAAVDDICPETEAAEIVLGFVDTADDVIETAAELCENVSPDEAEDTSDDQLLCDEEPEDEPDEQLTEDAPDEEDLLALIEEEEAEMALHMQQQEAASALPAEAFFLPDADEDNTAQEAGDAAETDEPAPVSQYMRYFDRSTDGEKFEVAEKHASGQEIICLDEESGRLSRVCGFIRNNQPAPPPVVDPLSEQE